MIGKLDVVCGPFQIFPLLCPAAVVPVWPHRWGACEKASPKGSTAEFDFTENNFAEGSEVIHSTFWWLYLSGF